MSLRILPLTLIPLIVYNIVAFAMAGPDTWAWLTAAKWQIPLPLGSKWAVSIGDILLLLTLVVLFIEVIKSTSTSTAVMIDHMLAMVVFVICLIEFLTVMRAGNSVFFAIMVAALIDVVAGFSISMRVARRSIGLGSS